MRGLHNYLCVRFWEWVQILHLFRIRISNLNELYDFLNKPRILQTKVHERPKVDKVRNKQNVKSPKVMVVAEPLKMKNFM